MNSVLLISVYIVMLFVMPPMLIAPVLAISIAIALK